MTLLFSRQETDDIDIYQGTLASEFRASATTYALLNIVDHDDEKPIQGARIKIYQGQELVQTMTSSIH